MARCLGCTGGCLGRTFYAGGMFCAMQILLKSVGVAIPNFVFQFVIALSGA